MDIDITQSRPSVSWWIDPAIQHDYAAFSAVLKLQVERMSITGQRFSWPIDFADRHLMKPTRH